MSGRAFPRRMAAALRAVVPGADVRVTVRGGRGMSDVDTLDVPRAELAACPHQLVIRQTGTVEAVRNLPPADFAQVLSDGATPVQDAGADLVLADQHEPRILRPSLAAGGGYAGRAAVPALRVDADWVNEGQMD